MSKRKKRIIIAAVVFTALLASLFTVLYNLPRYPFKDLTRESIKSVSVYSLSSKYTFVISEEEIDGLFAILKKQSVHGFTIDRSIQYYGGKEKMFIITYNDGRVEEVSAGGLDGLVYKKVSYHAEYNASQELFYYYDEILKNNNLMN